MGIGRQESADSRWATVDLSSGYDPSEGLDFSESHWKYQVIQELTT